MEEPEEIVRILDEFFDDTPRDLEGKKVMITAGPTHEKIDPVRYIGNYSSGKMGFALAEECSRRGAEVTVIAGPTSLKCSSRIRRIDVESCNEMFEAASDEFGKCDAAILCAAVADFRPETCAENKIKREGSMTITLMPNPDIAAALGKQKKPGQKIVGFALETNNEVSNADPFFLHNIAPVYSIQTKKATGFGLISDPFYAKTAPGPVPIRGISVQKCVAFPVCA